ncbi:tetratricopeptide repeat protein [Alteromonas sp. 14N.309.X.WAT.G.H12]|uniref:tetratricopeptide repeat protein n=1 Tax=Alteromonas sp. 14N.309.X.WAT.G.H12 TaxID=3120824 RepID=UPI002FD7031E
MTTKSESENLKNLVRQIFHHSELGLQYKTDANSIASETFANQAANCLSLTIMTYAMARYAGYDATFYEVEIPEFWTRRQGMNLLNGHINLRVSLPSNIQHRQFTDDHVDVDFDPGVIRSDFPRNAISQNEVLAMFYNNKGADALLAKQNTQAYAYFKKAASLFDGFGSTWVNLGVVYRRMGAYDAAKASYEKALRLNDNNLTAWENLAVLYKIQGDKGMAGRISKRIEAKRDANPFYHYILGEEALDYGEPEMALKYFQRARQLDRTQPEILYGIGKAHYELGDIDKALAYLKLAAKHAPNERDQDRYLSKLSSLQSAN